MRAALFLDFDNISISFAELDELAAHRFATQPARWLKWFESGAHDAGVEGGEAPTPRRILVRRCYLNPVVFGRYRSDYTRAAFTVVDCPPLTQRGKTSADVYMVMDVLDALEHPTRFDEFIILSSDADFTPVLLRLRAHDRRTTIIATNVAAAAYRAACDNVVPYDRFFEEALGIEAEQPALPEPTAAAVRVHDAPLPRVARALRDRVAAAGRLSARDVPAVFSAFPGFRNSNWFGCYSLRQLMLKLLELEPSLILEGNLSAAWSVSLGQPATPAQLPAPSGGAGSAADRVVEEVRRMLADSPRPIPMAAAAQRINTALGPAVRESDWLGHGTFKALLLARHAPDIAVLPIAPGYVYDPSRHDPSALAVQAGGEEHEGLPDELAAFIRRVADITGAPALRPADYAGLFREIAEAAAGDGANLTELSRVVRDRCQERGLRVSRPQVNFVLTGFRYAGVELAGSTAPGLARAWASNVRELCTNAQLELTPEEQRLMDAWILGGIENVSTGGPSGGDDRDEIEAATPDAESAADGAASDEDAELPPTAEPDAAPSPPA